MEATNPNALDCLVGQNSEEISTQTTGQNTHYLGLELRQELADLGSIHQLHLHVINTSMHPQFPVWDLFTVLN